MPNERESILRAAEAEFAGVGLERASLESVAARAGVEPGAVRALFVDKGTLLSELLIDATDPLVSGISLAVSETIDTRELLRRALRMYDAWMLDHPEIVRIMAHCTLEGPQSLGEHREVSAVSLAFDADIANRESVDDTGVAVGVELGLVESLYFRAGAVNSMAGYSDGGTWGFGLAFDIGAMRTRLDVSRYPGGYRLTDDENPVVYGVTVDYRR